MACPCCFGGFFSLPGLFLLSGLLLFNLLQQPLLVGEQVRDTRVLLELGAPFWVLLGVLSVFSLLCGGLFLDLVSQTSGAPLGLGLCGRSVRLVDTSLDRCFMDSLLGLLIDPAIFDSKRLGTLGYRWIE